MIKKYFTLKSIAWSIVAVSLIGINAYLIRKAIALQTKYVETKQVNLTQKIHNARQMLYTQLNAMTLEIEQSARKLTQADFDHLKQYLIQTAQPLSYVSSIGIAFEPYHYNTEKETHALYLIKQNNDFKEIPIQDYYNYLTTDWYKQAFETNAAWSQPFTEISTGESVLRFTVPLFTFDSSTHTRKRIGVLFVDISRTMLDLLANETVEDTDNYTFILSSDGYLITHPIESYLSEHETLENISRLPGKKEWRLVTHSIQKMHGGIVTYHDALINTSFWVAFEPLKIANWLLVYVSPKTKIFDREESRHLILQIAAGLLLLFLFLSISLLSFIQLQKRAWITSGLITLSLISLIVLQLYMTIHIVPESQQRIIKSSIDLARFKLFQQQRDKQLGKPSSLYIPTGISLDTILMHDANKIEIKGFLSQKYGPETKSLKKEINFFNCDTLTLKPLYHIEKDTTVTIGWSFSAIINFIYDKTTYPFNKIKLHVDMYHPDFEKNIILVPDFNAYEQHAAHKNIGIGSSLILEKNWHIDDSYFFYSLSDSQFNFGISNAIRKEDFPDMSFAVNMSQEIFNSLIAYLLPLIIIALVLFYILIESGMRFKKGAVIEQISLIGQVGALFLALVLAHQTLRNVLKISAIAYIESFYFIMYAFTLLIATNCMYIHKYSQTAYEPRFRTGIKYAYWPLIFGSILITTLYFFY